MSNAPFGLSASNVRCPKPVVVFSFMKAIYPRPVCVNEQQAMANRKPSQSWDNLRYFLAAARTGTLSAAAEQLGTEHTTVARHLHALEEELNSRLFHRSNSGYGPTEVGERLLPGRGD
jgi:hypothetical protein